MNKIEGRIEAVSEKNGAFIINGKWYNPESEDAKVKVQLLNDCLKNRKVILAVGDKPGTFKSFVLVDEHLSKEDYWKRKEERDIANDRKITRHGALNTALKLIEIQTRFNPQLSYNMYTMADDIIKWIGE